ncbi:MAG: bifunctional riboflavin kinase/FAD synthetase [Proteobacteria bacterium]|nr:bifunctional riboflavin kinase/FAD synthetase [Pseudomonadota bacterium]
MELFEGSDRFAGRGPGSPVVAIGIFDGVHIGHQELMRRARLEAQRRSALSIVYTFEPHPVRILSPAQCPKLLTTREQKIGQIRLQQLDAVIVERFTQEFARQEPGRFFEDVIRKKLRASCVVIGYDFTFGQHRQGTIETFEDLGRKSGVGVIVVPAVFAGETLVSSTVIRSMIAAGEVKRARALLGRPYEVVGEVAPGRGFGAALEAKTANLRVASEAQPMDGIYITRTLVHEGGYGAARPSKYASITSIGVNPTFSDAAHTFETHLIDMELDMMGKTVSVEFLERVRDQARFLSVDELRRRIRSDIDSAREYHSRSGG